jgi:hypothetical protein
VQGVSGALSSRHHGLPDSLAWAFPRLLAPRPRPSGLFNLSTGAVVKSGVCFDVLAKDVATGAVVSAEAVVHGYLTADQ